MHVLTQLSVCGDDRKWNALAGKAMAEDSLGLVLLQHGSFFDKMYLDYSKCSLHKPAFCATILVDHTVKYRSEINKSHHLIRAALIISSCIQVKLISGGSRL